jgi:hypothetical protein
MTVPGFREAELTRSPRGLAPLAPHAFGGLGEALAGRTGFTCGGPFCACAGDLDCNDLFTTGLCGPAAICFEQPGGGVLCICVRV